MQNTASKEQRMHCTQAEKSYWSWI